MAVLLLQAGDVWPADPARSVLGAKLGCWGAELLLYVARTLALAAAVSERRGGAAGGEDGGGASWVGGGCGGLLGCALVPLASPAAQAALLSRHLPAVLLCIEASGSTAAAYAGNLQVQLQARPRLACTSARELTWRWHVAEQHTVFQGADLACQSSQGPGQQCWQRTAAPAVRWSHQRSCLQMRGPPCCRAQGSAARSAAPHWGQSPASLQHNVHLGCQGDSPKLLQSRQSQMADADHTVAHLSTETLEAVL